MRDTFSGIASGMYKCISVGSVLQFRGFTSVLYLMSKFYIWWALVCKGPIWAHFLFWWTSKSLPNTVHSLGWIFTKNWLFLVLQLTHSFSLYNVAAFRPSSDGRVWSSAAHSAAEKHISGVYVGHLLRLMLTNVKSKQVIFTEPCGNYFQSWEVVQVSGLWLGGVVS